MPAGVEPCFSRSLVTTARRLQTRAFSSSAARASTSEHHTYFRHDSPVVYFPPHSRIIQQPSSLARIKPAFPHEITNKQSWIVFFGGFITFPILGLGVYWGDWAFGSTLWKSDLEELQQQGLAGGSRGAPNQFMEADHLYNVLQRANAETKALHDLILLWINPEHGLHAVKDTQLLKRNPIMMSTGKKLDPRKAILIRIMDKHSKTLVLLLGVDMIGHNGIESDPNTAWCQDHALRDWMDARAQELRNSSEAAEQGISLYCYTGTSSATSLSGPKGETWQESRLFPEDLPDRFPLSALESVKNEMQSDTARG